MSTIACMEPAASVAAPTERELDFLPPMGVLVRELSQLAALVGGLSDSQYARNSVDGFSSGIGSHVRHCLDHVRAFLTGLEDGRLDYDGRARGTDVETSRLAALRAIRGLERQLCTMLSQRLDRPLRLSVLVTSRGPAMDVPTSAGRELAFVLSHTTHHNAMIAAMAKIMGVTLPPQFGIAPSTLAYHEAVACAP